MGANRAQPPSTQDDIPVEKRYCRVPRCLERRAQQRQENGRFLVEYWQDGQSVYVTLVCPDCGTQHTIQIVKS